MLVPDEHYVKIGSINTRYWAEGEGYPVVLVHGMGGSATGWLTSIGGLSAQYRIYALDLIGHGRTDKPQSMPYKFFDLVKFVNEFMTELKIDQAHIVGHSMGGAISMRLAIDFPTCSRKLILVDTAGLGREIKYLYRLVSIPIVGEILASQAYTPDVKKFGNGLRSAAKNTTYITDELVENIFRIEESPTQYKNTLKILRTCVNWVGQKKSFYAPIMQQLPSITNPTLVIWGRQDDVVPIKHGEFAVKSLPNAYLETIDECGHVPMFDQPEVFKKLVLEFLKE
jgi:pimeloyl-ACP methyl ester carboxylesterase